MISFSYDEPTVVNTEVTVTFTNTENNQTYDMDLMPVWIDPDPLTDGDEFFDRVATDSKFEVISITYDVLQNLNNEE